MHVDFCFVDRGGRGLIAGWSAEPSPSLALMFGCERLAVSMVSRFPRRDLGSSGQGLMASFRLRNPSVLTSDPPELTIVADGELKEFAPERLTHDEENLVTAGVDEIFAAYLRAIAAGIYGRPRREITRTILNRIQGNLRALPAETPVVAVNLDRVLVSPSGLGVFTGWCLTDRAHPNALVALVSGGRTLQTARIVLNSIKREDLSVYRDRYRFTGTNGFCGAFRLPTNADRDARMVLLSNVANSDFVFGREAELVSDEEAALALCELRASMTDPRTAEALTRAAAPRLPAEPFRTPAPAGPAAGAEVVVALEVDVTPVELRDCLRLLHTSLSRGFTLHLLGRHEGAASHSLQAAVAESGGAIVVGEPLSTAQLLSHQFDESRLIYGRASTFFQMSLPVPGEGTAAYVTYHDPIGALPGAVADTAWPGAQNPPFLLSAPGRLARAAFEAVPQGFITPDGMMRAAIDVLAQHGMLRAQRAGGPTWYPGSEMQSHPEYAVARALDSEMRVLVGLEEKA